MHALLGPTLTMIYINAEIRSAWCGLSLSNGKEVLVSPETYREILERYAELDVTDPSDRWDRAILEILRPMRPNEWKYLVRSLIS